MTRPRARTQPRRGAVRAPTRAPTRDPAAWQADVVPVAITLDDDPAARPALTMVTCRGRILSAEVIARPPADAVGVAELLARAVLHIVTRDGGDAHPIPATIEVRHPDVAALLPGLLATLPATLRPAMPAPSVAAFDDLDQIDDAVASYEEQVAGRPPGAVHGQQPRMSRPRTWAEWGLPAPLIARFFAAAATYYRGAPWRRFINDDLLRVTVPRGAVWTATVMGDARELFGLALYERLDDHLAIRAGPSPEEAFANVRGGVLSLSFGSRDDAEPATRIEVIRQRWEVASGNAWPDLFALNTLGGGIAEAWMEDLILVLRAIPRFAKRFAPPPESDDGTLIVSDVWTDSKSGTTIEVVRVSG